MDAVEDMAPPLAEEPGSEAEFLFLPQESVACATRWLGPRNYIIRSCISHAVAVTAAIAGSRKVIGRLGSACVMPTRSVIAAHCVDGTRRLINEEQ